AQTRVWVSFEFDDGTHILEDHITGRTLGQAVRDLLADDLVLRRIQPLCLFAGQGDGFTGSLDCVEEQSVFSGRGWAWRVCSGNGRRRSGCPGAGGGVLPSPPKSLKASWRLYRSGLRRSDF
ncbi:MAG: hypothetical protein JZL64_13550, partial [Ferrovum myxofaciens]|nr:hypothetical protein [Ferrovum myxofaciens]